MSQTQATATDRTASRKAAASAATASNGQDHASDNLTFEIDGKQVTTPPLVKVGQPFTADHVAVYTAAVIRQFQNNENAMAKARADKLAKATSDAERTAIQATIDEWTAQKYAEKFATYVPNVGGSRMGSMEKVRQEAAKRVLAAWLLEIGKQINTIMQTDAAGNLVLVNNKPVVAPGGSIPEQRDRLVARILEMPKYAEALQTQVDAILTERKGGGGSNGQKATADELEAAL